MIPRRVATKKYGNVYYNFYGEVKNPAVFFVNGFLQPADKWGRRIMQLEKDYALCMTDMPGCGLLKDTPFVDFNYLVQCASILHEQIKDYLLLVSKTHPDKENFPKKVSLVGYSLGANIALLYLSLYSDCLIDKYVHIDMGPSPRNQKRIILDDEGKDEKIAKRLSYFRGYVESRDDVDTGFTFKELDEDIQKEYESVMSEASSTAKMIILLGRLGIQKTPIYTDWYKVLRITHSMFLDDSDASSCLPNLKLDVLVATGTKSNEFRKFGGMVIEKEAKHVRRVLINTGHFWIPRSAEFHKYLREFLTP